MVDGIKFTVSNLEKRLEKTVEFDELHGFFGPSVEIRTRGLLNPIHGKSVVYQCFFDFYV